MVEIMCITRVAHHLCVRGGVSPLPEDEAGAQQGDDRLIGPCVAVLIIVSRHNKHKHIISRRRGGERR